LLVDDWVGVGSQRLERLVVHPLDAGADYAPSPLGSATAIARRRLSIKLTVPSQFDIVFAVGANSLASRTENLNEDCD
jgi:hypothetical protein